MNPWSSFLNPLLLQFSPSNKWQLHPASCSGPERLIYPVLSHPMCNLSGRLVGSVLKIPPASGHFSPPLPLRPWSGARSFVTWTIAIISYKSPCFCPCSTKVYSQQSSLLRHKTGHTTHLLKIFQWLPSCWIKAWTLQVDHCPHPAGLIPFSPLPHKSCYMHTCVLAIPQAS